MSEQLSSRWRQFLSEQGAVWENDTLTAFATSGAAQAPRLMPLEHQALLTVAGPDAEKFLQGQTTADMRRLNNAKVLLGGHCDHKGRMHSSFIAATVSAENEPSIGLRIHRSLAQSARAALQKYIVFSKAKLELADNLRVLAVSGTSATEALQQLKLALPEADGHFQASPEGTVLRHTADRFELWLPEEAAENAWLALAPHCRAAAPAEWDLEQIRLGYGQVRAETAGEFIPQMFNFQSIGGISFDKGCYTGQEVVARMHYLGKSKKHIYRATVTAQEVPAPATPVFAENSEQAAGQVAMAASAGTGKVEMLLVCSETAAEQPLTLAAPTGPQLQLQSLPYSLD